MKHTDWRVRSAVCGLIALLALTACSDGGDESAEAVENVAANVAGEPAPDLVVVPPEPPVDPIPETALAPVDLPPAGDDAAAPEPPVFVEEGPAAPPLVTDDPPLTAELSTLIDGADTVAGRTYLQRCAACHAVDPTTQGPGAAQIGPPLTDVIGRLIGGVTGFDYSPVFEAMRETGAVWTEARLDIFLADSNVAAPGTAMSVAGVTSPQDRANIIAFLKELAGAERGAADNPELLSRITGADPEVGQALSARCSGCHRFELGATPLIGPNLFDIVGKPAGEAAGFAYSPALRALDADGALWTYDLLDAFLESPAAAVPGTRMGFAGVGDADERAAIIAYLRTLSPAPPPIFTTEEGVGNQQAGLNALEFDVAQTELGGTYYADNCAACHRSDLRGEVDMREEGFGVAPPLTGPNFVQRWYRGTVFDFFAYLQSSKPREDPGTMDPRILVDIIAYLLARNGFAPGGTTLTPDSETLEGMGFYQ